MDNKIPKIIHYCWFSGEAIPKFLDDCINTWKKVMPDYTLKLWDANSFDFDSVPFVREAFKAKKWAFVADYIRLYALYTEGGIYMDSDVRVFKSFNEFLCYDFFTSHEYHPGNFTDSERRKLDKEGSPINKADYIIGLNVQAAVMGSSKGNEYIHECLQFYKDKSFLDSSGKPKTVEFIIGPYISKVAEKYGYKYNLKKQVLAGNMIILPPEYFVGNSEFLTRDSYAIHLCNGSWKEQELIGSFLYKVRNNFPSLYPPIYTVVKGLNFFRRKLSN